MADVKSYAWSHQLAEEVKPGETVEVPTPGFENPENYDTAKTQVVYGSNVLLPEQVGIAWEGDFTKVTLTNSSEDHPWEVAVQVYVTVPGVPFDPENVEESFNTLSAKVDDHETRITTLEGAVLGSKAPTAHSAKAPEPHKAAQAAPVAPKPAQEPPSAHKPGAPAPQRPPQHRGSAKT